MREGYTPESSKAATLLTVFGLAPTPELNKLQLEALIDLRLTSSEVERLLLLLLSWFCI